MYMCDYSGRLFDRTYDWDSPLPTAPWNRASHQHELADVALCLVSASLAHVVGFGLTIMIIKICDVLH
jgi:hypothetical protein